MAKYIPARPVHFTPGVTNSLRYSIECFNYARYHRLRYDNDSWLLAYSDGLASRVMLDILVDAFPRDTIRLFHMQLLPKLDVTGLMCAYVKRRWKTKPTLITHWRTHSSYRRQFGFGMGLDNNELHRVLDQHWCNRYCTTEEEVEDEVRRQCYTEWICYGHRQVDLPKVSGTKASSIHSGMGVDSARGYVYPMRHWSDSDLVNYAMEHDIAIGSKWGGVIINSGNITISPWGMSYLRQEFIDDYHKVVKVWPFAMELAKEFDDRTITNQIITPDNVDSNAGDGTGITAGLVANANTDDAEAIDLLNLLSLPETPDISQENTWRRRSNAGRKVTCECGTCLKCKNRVWARIYRDRKLQLRQLRRLGIDTVTDTVAGTGTGS